MKKIDIEDLYKEIGERIKEKRENRKPKFSQQKLSKRIGISRTSMVNIEKGRHHIQIHTLYHIASALGTDIEFLLPVLDGEKLLKVTSPVELSTKTKKSLEKLISSYDKKEVKFDE